MIDNQTILNVAYLCKMSYNSQEEINSIFLEKNEPFCSLINKCEKIPTLKEGSVDDCEVYTVIYDNTLLIIFRGTESISDVISDINIIKDPLIIKNSTRTPMVHRGFLKQLESVNKHLENSIFEYIKTNPSGSIITCGHSLGGGIASIAALRYTDKFEIPTYCITFGSPRAGDTYFCEKFNENILLSIRVVDEDDPVSLIPPPFTYRHVDGVKWIYDGKILTKTKQCCKWLRFCKNFFMSCLMCCLTSAFDDHGIDKYIEDLENIENFENFENLSQNIEKLDIEI